MPAWAHGAVVGRLGGGPVDRVNAAALDAAEGERRARAPRPESLKVAKGFKVELLYTVPKDDAGLVGQHDASTRRAG